MGYKNVCVNCRISFNQGTDYTRFRTQKCPECHRTMIPMNHRFKPPKKSDLKKWDTVRYLLEKEFFYQHIYDNAILNSYVPYPESIREAREFVEKYRDQALELDQIEKIMAELK